MAIPLPDPTVIAGRRYWPKGEIRAWTAAIADKPAPEPQPDDEQLLLPGSSSASYLSFAISDRKLSPGLPSRSALGGCLARAEP